MLLASSFPTDGHAFWYVGRPWFTPQDSVGDVTVDCTDSSLGLVPHSRRAGSQSRVHPAVAGRRPQTYARSVADGVRLLHFRPGLLCLGKDAQPAALSVLGSGRALPPQAHECLKTKALGPAANRGPCLTGSCGRGRPRKVAPSLRVPKAQQLGPRRGRFVGASRQQVLGPLGPHEFHDRCQ